MSDIKNVQRGVPANKVGESVGLAVLDPRTKKVTVKPEGGGRWTVTVLRSQ